MFRGRNKQGGKGGGRMGGEHKMRANEESVKTGGAELDEIGVRAQAGFADGDAFVGNAPDQFERGIDLNGQGLQVAVVYTDDARTGSERAIELFSGVNFDERLHADLAAKSEEVTNQAICKCGNNQQKTVGVVGARFPNLPGIENKIFAQDWELNRLAGIAQILQ